jgi:quercetin dioxygenase-like cupin family protein
MSINHGAPIVWQHIYNNEIMSTHVDWSSQTAEQLSPKITRQYVSQPGMTLAQFKLTKGAHVPQHSHINAQITNVFQGVLRFHMEGKSILVRAGETLFIPPNEPHEVFVDEDAVVLDIFTPERADWAAGADAYLRTVAK